MSKKDIIDPKISSNKLEELEKSKELFDNYCNILKDSGSKREFETGAVRDMAEGKGRCDLLPAAALIRLSKHYEAGANKYGARNWEKGQPMSVLLDSGIRHLLKYLDGWTDEDHLAAAAWNILGAMWMEEKKPELQDIPTRGLRAQNGVVDELLYPYEKEMNDYTSISDGDRFFLIKALESGGISDIKTLSEWINRRLA